MTTQQVNSLIADAKTAGFTINQDGEYVSIFDLTPKTGKLRKGVVIFSDTAFDATVDLSAAKALKNVKVVRNLLSL